MSSAELLTVHIDTRGSAVIVSVSGELDLATVPVLRERLDSVGEKLAAPLVIDLSEVRFIASAGLSLLVDLQRRCDARGVALAIVATGSVVPRAIQITALDQVLAVHSTVDEAVDGGTEQT